MPGYVINKNLILIVLLITLIFFGGCFGIVGDYLKQSRDLEQIETLEGIYIFEGTSADSGYLLFDIDGTWELIETGETIYSGHYKIISDRVYVTEGDQVPTGDYGEESFELRDKRESLIDIDGYVWRKDTFESPDDQTQIVSVTNEATPPPTYVTVTQTPKSEPDPILEFPPGIEGVIFTIHAEPNIPAGKLTIGVTIDSRGLGESEEIEGTDIPLQNLRITLFAYNYNDVEEGFIPRSFSEVYYSEIPYKTRHHTINAGVTESKGADLPIDSARGWLDVTKAYNYGAIIEII